MKKKTVIITRKYEVWVIRQFSQQSDCTAPPEGQTGAATSLERFVDRVTVNPVSLEGSHEDETPQASEDSTIS